MTKIILVVDVDPELSNPGHPTGLSAIGLDELQSGLSQVGTLVGMPERWLGDAKPLPTTPVPAAPKSSPPVTPDQSRAFNRRRLALEHASHLIRATLPGRFNTAEETAEGIVTIATWIDTYLEGSD